VTVADPAAGVPAETAVTFGGVTSPPDPSDVTTEVVPENAGTATRCSVMVPLLSVNSETDVVTSVVPVRSVLTVCPAAS
jgi:hypothetical protein